MFDQLFASKKNPRFKQDSQWDKLRFDLSGCQLEISLPPQDWEFPEDPRPSSVNLFDSELYDYHDKPDKNGFDAHYKGVSNSAIFSRRWNLYGSLFRRQAIGSLQSAASVIDVSKMKNHLNCFSKKYMEQLVLHDLYYSKGPGFGGNEYDSPINWRVLNIKGIEWIYTESWLRASERQGLPETCLASRCKTNLFSPIFEDKYLSLSFNATGSNPPEPSNKLMFERINKIISTIYLSLTPDGERQKSVVIESGEKDQYSTSRKPEDWKYYGSYRRTEDGVEFEGRCSPPPKLG